MKKIFFILYSLFICAFTLQAQVYLSDVLKPSKEHRLTIIKSTNKDDSSNNDFIRLSNAFMTKGGIKIGGAAQGLVGGDDNGYATFYLNKNYEKMSFWFGSGQWRAGIKRKAILTIEADGKRLFDKPVFSYSEPTFITLNVSGKDSVTFKVMVGEIDVALAYLQLWKAGETVKQPDLKYNLPSGKAQLVEQIMPYFTSGTAQAIHKPYPSNPVGDKPDYPKTVDDISIGRHTFKTGLLLANYQGLCDETAGDAFFWLRKKYDKLSFIVGPRDNKSSNASAWLVVYGDNNKIIYEDIVRQTDLPRQVVINVAQQERVRFSCEFRSSEFLGGITFGAVDIYAYTKDYADIPKEGIVNVNKDQIAKLPSPCALMSNIKPYSVHGFANADDVRFTGESSYITFSMGGEKFSEGIILTTGKKLLGDQVAAYMNFDLAGEFDYISFYAGMLTNRRVLDDDRLLVYADSTLILDTMIHCTWPNQYFELPINKCRMLKFAKRGNPNADKQSYIGVGDIALYRGKPVKHDLFYHERPECPEQADLIDLCTRPYFHYVGRYLSTLTNFDFNDCFQNGETKRRFFQMKDGSQIYKGVMLEANVPLAFEDVSVSDAIMMFFVGAGSALSQSDFAAYSGTSAGAGLTGQMAILHLLHNQNGGQASVVAFNPYGEYESCTFTIANKAEYWDDMDKLVNLGQQIDHHYNLHVFADQRLVKTIEVYNKMEPQTFTVPIFKCHQLMFWLEPGERRSGQFVLYNMTVSKKPCNIPVPDKLSTNSIATPIQPTKTAQPAPQPTKTADHTPTKETSQPVKQQQPQQQQQQQQPQQQPQTQQQSAAQQINALKSNSINTNKRSNTLAPKK